MKKLIAIAALLAATANPAGAASQRQECAWRKFLENASVEHLMTAEEAEAFLMKNVPDAAKKAKKDTYEQIAALEKFQEETKLTDRQMSAMLLAQGSEAKSTAKRDKLWLFMGCW